MDTDTFTGVLALDYLGDLIFLVDVRLRMTAFAFMDGDKVVKDLNKIKERYFEGGLLHGKSLQDLLAILPLEILVVALKIPNLKMVQVFSLLRLNKVFRVGRLGEHIRCFDNMYAYFMNNGYKNELKVGKLFATIMVVSHWLGCIFFFLAFIQFKLGVAHWADCSAGNPANRFFPCYISNSTALSDAEKLKQQELAEVPVNWDTGDRYIRSVYWAVTALTTAGYGDVSATTTLEQSFSIFTLIVGILLFSTVIANLEEIVAQLDVTSTLFAQKMDDIKMLMQVRQIPEEVAEEIMAYYNTLWLKQKGVSEIAVLNYLPGRIRHEVLKFHCAKVFKTAPVFEKFESSFIDLILDELQSDFFLQGDVVYEKGECGKELYILTRGAVDLVDGKNKLMSVGMGSLLGEDEFFKHEPRICGAVAAEFSTMFMILYDDLMRLLRNDRSQDIIYKQQKEEAKDRIDTGSKIEKMKKNLKGGGKMAHMLMLDDATTEKKDLVFLPDSEFRRAWDLILLVLTFINFVFVPLRAAFYGESMKNETEELIWVIVFFLMDVVFMVDIFFNIRFFATVDEGLLIAVRDDFKLVYLRGRFKWDLIACVPADLVFWIITGMGPGSKPRNVALVRMLRFIHIMRLPAMLQSVVDYLEEKGVRLKAGVWHLAKIFYFIVICTHFYACLFYYIAVLEGLDDEHAWTSGTALEDEDVDLYSKYFTSLYWSAYTITLVGYGDITLKSNGEFMFAVLAMLTGSVLCDAGITAIMSSLVQATDESAGMAQAWSKVISKFVKHRSIPQGTQDQIFGFFVHMHLQEHDLDEEKVLNAQSRAVKSKLLRAICFDGMRKFPTLKPFLDGFVKSICQGMFPYLALPTEILIAEGEVCDRVFLIVRGTVHVLEKGGSQNKDLASSPVAGATDGASKYNVVFTLENGSIIGDFKPNEYTFRAVEYSECYVLGLEHYVECFSYVHNNRRASKRNIKDDMDKLDEGGETEEKERAQFIVSKKKRRESSFEAVKNKFVRRSERSKGDGPEDDARSGASFKQHGGRSKSGRIEAVIE
jgi:CRP-like cAMP-binding protein